MEDTIRSVSTQPLLWFEAMARPLNADATGKLRASTAEIVFTDGVDACTVEEVSRRSGVAKSTIYRRYDDVDAMIFDMVASRVTEPAAVDTGTLEGDVRAIMRRYLKASQQPTTRQLYLWMAQRAQREPRLAELFNKARVQPGGPTTVALERAKTRGEISTDLNIETALHMIQGPFFTKRLVENADPGRKEFDQMITMIVAALKSTL